VSTTVAPGTEPNADAVEIMAQVDAMPAAHRALVHEYGLVIVRHLAESMSTKEMRSFLVAWREMKQQEIANADYRPQRGQRHLRAVRR